MDNQQQLTKGVKYSKCGKVAMLNYGKTVLLYNHFFHPLSTPAAAFHSSLDWPTSFISYSLCCKHHE